MSLNAFVGAMMPPSGVFDWEEPLTTMVYRGRFFSDKYHALREAYFCRKAKRAR